MAALLFFCGATIDTLGEYKVPPPVQPSEPVSPAYAHVEENYENLVSNNVVVKTTERAAAEAAHVNTILHDSVWMIEVVLMAFGLLLLTIVVYRFITSHERWQPVNKRQLALNLARQKTERSRKND
jgi:hypothetical protein